MNPWRGTRGGITTTGTGSVEVTPDVVVARLAAHADDEDAPRALARATEALTRLRDALVAAGVGPADLRTSGTSSWTDPGDAGRPARTTVHMSLEARLPSDGPVGDTVREALAAAGEAGRLDGLDLAVRDAGDAYERARGAAFDAAVAAAAQIAGLAGRTLGPVVDVREEGTEAVHARAGSFALAKADSMPVEAGTQQVTVRLVVRHGWAPDPADEGSEEPGSMPNP